MLYNTYYVIQLYIIQHIMLYNLYTKRNWTFRKIGPFAVTKFGHRMELKYCGIFSAGFSVRDSAAFL